MQKPANTPLPVDPPPGVPLDQTKAEIYYGGSGAGIGIVWLWRKIRSRFAARRSSGSS
jgi:hypothetical protein